MSWNGPFITYPVYAKSCKFEFFSWKQDTTAHRNKRQHRLHQQSSFIYSLLSFSFLNTKPTKQQAGVEWIFLYLMWPLSLSSPPGFFPTVHLSLWGWLWWWSSQNSPRRLLLHESVPQVGERSLVGLSQRATFLSAVHNSHWFVTWYYVVPEAGWDISPHTFIFCSLPAWHEGIWGQLQRKKMATHLRWVRCCLLFVTPGAAWRRRFIPTAHTFSVWSDLCLNMCNNKQAECNLT